MPTIQDVASFAGVSTATVSRVLSSPALVAVATRERVSAAVRHLGYAPNAAAKMLRTTKTKKIVVTVPDISNPFFALVLRGVEEAAQAVGYSVLLGDTRGMAEREEQYAAMLHRREADGIIYLGNRLPTTLTPLFNTPGYNPPVVNGCEFDATVPVSSVHIDNAAAAGTAIAHLYDLGHRRIAVITGPLISPLSRDRLAGVRGAIAARHEAIELTVVSGEFSIGSGEALTRDLIGGDVPPTALFCFSDEIAMGALTAIRAAGLRCPDDLSVMGFDDIRYAALMEPPLTTIRQPMDDLGRETVRLMLQALDDPSLAPVQQTLKHEIVVRRSTGVAPAARTG
jgi:LacI family repressor for deo operon, udp, cdd, tsx, nupC, and nupG